MDTSNYPSLWPASPGALLFEQQPPFQPLVELTLVGEDIGNVSESHRSSKERWESLKPLIQRVYIDENKPFSYLARILRDEYEFTPTKRMFDRKIAKWGFRKNISRAERRDLLLKLPGDGNAQAPESIDRRLKSGKLKNWQRRYNEEELGVPLALVQQGEPQRLVPEPIPLLDQDVIEITDLPEPSLEGVRELSPSPEFESYGNEAQIRQVEEILDWSALGVPDSPKLSRLFRALDIECSKQLPPISLDDTSWDSEEPTCISDLEMRDLCNENNKDLSVDLVLPRRDEKSVAYLTSDSSSQQIHYPWRDIKSVFCGYRSPSPFNEIYVFPPSRASERAPKPVATVWASLQMEETELEAKFGKLKKQFPIHHAAVIAVMKDLADTYFDLDHLQKAERLYRSLVDVYQRTLGPTNLKTLMACRDVINSFVNQGRWSEVQSLCRDVRFAISKLVSPYHELAVWMNKADADVAFALGQNKREEALRREQLQVMLVLNGPRHMETIKAMRNLAVCLAQRETREAEKLARNAVQLCLENPTGDEEACLTMGALADTLYRKSEFMESCSLAENAIKKFTDSLGSDHSVIVQSQTDLAWSLCEVGKLAESEEIFRGLVLCIAQDGKVNTQLNILGGLGNVLEKQGRVDEAIPWHEKSFQGYLDSCGPFNSITVNRCGKLGHCYEKRDRYSDALQLYQKMISSIKDTTRDENDEEDPNELIAEVEQWIQELEEIAKEQ